MGASSQGRRRWIHLLDSSIWQVFPLSFGASGTTFVAPFGPRLERSLVRRFGVLRRRLLFYSRRTRRGVVRVSFAPFDRRRRGPYLDLANELLPDRFVDTVFEVTGEV